MIVLDEPHAVTATLATAIPSDRSLRRGETAGAGATEDDSLTTELYGRPTMTLKTS